MTALTFFRAINNETGEVLEGSKGEIAEKLGVLPAAINQAAILKENIDTHWKIRKIVSEKLESSNGNFPIELRKEWDRVTEPFKEASRKKAMCRIR